MYELERTFAFEVVAEACAMARRVQDRISTTGDAVTKADRSPVTVADLAIQVLVSHRLAERFPGDGLLAEEDTAAIDADPALAGQVLELSQQAAPGLTADAMRRALGRGDHSGGVARHWVLDPVDGTKGFLRGEQFAVALALIDGGRLAAGALGCPRLPPANGSPGEGSIFSAETGCGATERRLGSAADRPIAVDTISDPSLAAFCESVEAAHAAHSVQAEIAARLGIRRPPVRIDSQCKYAVVARGDASVYLRLPSRADYREKVWDHAAGALIIEQAGGRVSDLDGRPLDVSAGRFLARSRGIVATNGRLHEAVLAACREVLGLE
jgi:HAL2 family 3'(2'),5'-bisphosphate nucleotidase